jgi:hypothetical protein
MTTNLSKKEKALEFRLELRRLCLFARDAIVTGE